MTASSAPPSLRLLELLRTAVDRLAELQHRADGATHLRGEFPMWIDGPVSRSDHNYLSGYALLHVALASRLPGLPTPLHRDLERLLSTARRLPGRYQSPRGLGNWYSGRGHGLPAPVGYPWPDGRVRCLHDDYDDTAISAILTTLAPFELAAPITVATFERAAHDSRRDALAPNSSRRLELSGARDGVYHSWAVEARHDTRPPGDHEWLPAVNSVELTTVANVYTAVHRLGGDPASPAQLASRHFVNALVTHGVQRLLDGDASHLDIASTYYPRFPFAPLAYIVHDHVLTGGALLSATTADLIARALMEVPPDAAWRMRGPGTIAFWLSCCAWSMRAGLVDAAAVAPTIDRVLGDLHADRNPLWPDLVFFHGAHVGDYSGRPYALALMIETLALLHAEGLG